MVFDLLNGGGRGFYQEVQYTRSLLLILAAVLVLFFIVLLLIYLVLFGQSVLIQRPQQTRSGISGSWIS